MVLRRFYKFALFLILLSAGWTTLAHASAEQTQTFTYEGQLLDASGTSPLTGTVDFTFTIYNPSEDCLLYEESQTGFDMTASDGRFSVLIGSTAGNAKRTASDPGLNMSDVFRNDGASIRASSTANCTPGYAATAGDARKLRVSVSVNGGSTITLTPDETIGSVPQAWVAETLQGYGPENFVRISGSNAVIPNGNGLVVNGTQVIDSSGNWTGGTVSGTGSITAPTFYGSSSPNGNMTLDSTSNGTKGNIIIAPNGGNVGIGTTAPANALDVNGGVAIGSYAGTGFAAPTGGLVVSGNVGIGSTGTSGNALMVGNTTNEFGIQSNMTTTNLGISGSAALYAKNTSIISSTGTSGAYAAYGGEFFIQPMIATGMSNTSKASGITSLALRNRSSQATDDSGSLSQLFGEEISYGHNNTVATGTPQTTTAIGLQISPYTRSGTIANMYDLYLNSAAAGSGTVSGGHWGLYQEDTSIKNFVAGTLGIGQSNSSPAVQLDVRGTGGAPASTGTVQTGIMRLWNVTNGNSVLDFGNYIASPYGSWIQSTRKSDLSTNYPLVLNPNGGNVGIGTSSPGISTSAGRNYLTIKGASDAGVLELTQGSADADVADIGQISFTDKASSKRAALIAGHTAGSTANNRGGSLAFYTKPDNSSTITARMWIDNAGQVGIGTTAPAAALDIASGQIFTSGGSSSAPAYSFAGSPATGMFWPGSGSGGGRIGFSHNNNEMMEMGSQTLVMHPNLILEWSSSASSPFYANSVDIGLTRKAAGVLEVNSGSTGDYRDVQLRALNPSSGNVGIGTTNPSTTLQVAGEISPSADNAYSLGDSSLRFSAVYSTNGTIQTSDARFKDDIRESDLGLDFINQLRPVSYRWKSGSDTSLHYGLIAQETEKAVQDFHTVNRDEKTPIVDHDEKTDRYGLRYTELISPLIKSVQELYQRLTDLEAVKTENAQLKQENAEIKARLDRIERTLSSKP